ncbi:hypothetical protein GCM10010361_59070 [Streptomyces olivaceiscleroticus]|uniref:Uncharacterized protein n=2 Tax=Streptomyces olivaceiscleroticus TaxID=68245 RepID=A0ABN1AY87_9ACTN
MGAPTLRGMSYADLRELQTALTLAADLASGLQQAPSRQDADRLVDVLRHALTTAGSLGSEPDPAGGPTGCAAHPHGAVDPLYGDPEDPLPPGYGKCLLCNDRRRRADARPHPPLRRSA